MEHTRPPVPMGVSRRRTLDPAIGRMLAARRRARGWSLRAAARHIGIPFSYIRLLERGERAPSVVVAAILGRVYDLTGDDWSRLMSGAVEDVGRDYPGPWAVSHPPPRPGERYGPDAGVDGG